MRKAASWCGVLPASAGSAAVASLGPGAALTPPAATIKPAPALASSKARRETGLAFGDSAAWYIAALQVVSWTGYWPVRKDGLVRQLRSMRSTATSALIGILGSIATPPHRDRTKGVGQQPHD